MNPTAQGRFITFEGGEGTGKSTQANLLAARLRPIGIEVLVTREPGGSPGAEAIRHVLLSGAAKPLGTHAEALLFAAARDDHVRQTIRPALARGAWVICDRFADSTRIYQGTLGNVDPRVIRGLERISVGPTRPDLTIVLDLPAELGLKRAAARRGHEKADRFETETLDFHRKLRDAFRELAEREPERCVLIDASGDVDTVANAVWAAVNERLEPGRAPAATIEDLVP
jgi:dTMP kinase